MSENKNNSVNAATHRLSPEDVKGSVHNFRDTNTSVVPEATQENAYYTFFGKHQFLDELKYPRLIDDEHEELVYAKVVIVGSTPKYYVREERGKPYNPNPIINSANKDKDKCVASIRYMQVSPNVFKLYLNFLKTKNNAHLLNATRSLV